LLEERIEGRAAMNPRLMVMCVGGLAGAVACCDMDEGLDELQVAAEGEGADAVSAEPEAGAITETDAGVVH
jgi:hypothetical protein